MEEVKGEMAVGEMVSIPLPLRHQPQLGIFCALFSCVASIPSRRLTFSHTAHTAHLWMILAEEQHSQQSFQLLGEGWHWEEPQPLVQQF